MALRRLIFQTLLLLASLIQSLSVSAKNDGGDGAIRKHFVEAKELGKKGRPGDALHYLSKYYNFKSPKTPVALLDLVAALQEKAGRKKEAIYSNTLLLELKYGRAFSQALKSYHKSGNTDDMPDLPERAGVYLGRIGLIYGREFLSHGKQSDFKNAKMFLEMAVETDDDGQVSEKMLAQINERQESARNSIYQMRYFASLGMSSWRDEIVEQAQNGGPSSDVYTTTRGVALGGGLSLANSYWEYLLEGKVAFATGTVESDSFVQEKVPENGVFVALGGYWRPKESVGLGGDLGVIYRLGDFTERDGQSLVSKNQLGILANLAARWREGDFGIVSKLGKATHFKGSVWALDLLYYF